MRIRLLALILAAAAGTFSLSASGTETTPPAGVARTTTTTYAIGFVAGDHFEQAEALNRALKKALQLSTNQRLGTGDFSIEVLTAALGCKERPEPSCLKKIANKIGSQRYLWGTLNLEDQRIRVELHYYSEDAADKKVSFSYLASLSDSMDNDLLGIATNSLSQLMGPLRYRVAVHSKQKSGSVWVNGSEAGQLVNGELELELTPGEHQFQLRNTKAHPTGTDAPAGQQKLHNADGNATLETPSANDKNLQSLATVNARVQVAELTKVRLDPESHPQTLASPAPAPATPATPKPDSAAPAPFIEPEATSGNAQRTWGYIGLGVGSGLIVGGAVAAASLYVLNQKESFQRYREGLPANLNACDEAKHDRRITGAMAPDDVRQLCHRASLLEVAEVVLFSTGVVAAGTGLTLLLTSKSSTSTAQQTLVPNVSLRPGRTDVGVTWHF
jgi:hypothetical protein